MKRFYFGYDGGSLVFWEDARNLPGLFRKLRERGMERPDWVDPVNTKPAKLPRSH